MPTPSKPVLLNPHGVCRLWVPCDTRSRRDASGSRVRLRVALALDLRAALALASSQLLYASRTVVSSDPRAARLVRQRNGTSTASKAPSRYCRLTPPAGPRRGRRHYRLGLSVQRVRVVRIEAAEPLTAPHGRLVPPVRKGSMEIGPRRPTEGCPICYPCRFRTRQTCSDGKRLAHSAVTVP